MSKVILDPNFVPLVPTQTFKASSGNVTVVTRLYGTVTPDRLVREMATTKYRAEQLAK